MIGIHNGQGMTVYETYNSETIAERDRKFVSSATYQRGTPAIGINMRAHPLQGVLMPLLCFGVARRHERHFTNKNRCESRCALGCCGNPYLQRPS
jgi:hypothetical protein